MPNKLFNLLRGVTLMISLLGCMLESSGQLVDKIDFKNPSQRVGLHIWWHWLDGSITREGVTKDLESMKQQGIVQATILNVGAFGNVFKMQSIKFNTEEWYGMFNWALQEANRLGITIGVHNCDGWSSSGGPWITPELSMKKFVFSKMLIKGNGQKTIKLPKPYCNKNFYKDVAVVACKTDKFNQSSFQRLCPKVSLNDNFDAPFLYDGSPLSMVEMKKGDSIRISFDTEFAADKIAIFPSYNLIPIRPTSKSKYLLMASADGLKYKKIQEFGTTGFNKVSIVDIPHVKAKFYKIVLKDVSELEGWNHFTLAEVELLKQGETPFYSPSVLYAMEKTVAVGTDNSNILNSNNPLSGGFIPENSIVDLTKKMGDDGTLNWDVPEGNWSVIRFGYTTTGAHNAPATPGGAGLECDKMDSSAVNFHFSNFPQKLITHSGEFCGNTFKFLLIDSWECAFQNWTSSMPAEFEKLRGYSLINWIPALCGEVVGNAELTDGFLYDFRKTIADLIEQNYYKQFSNLCHKNGLELHAEVIYGGGNNPPIDVLKTNSFIDLPMSEFWTKEDRYNLVKYDPSHNNLPKLPVYSSAFYGNPLVGAEAYTSYAHFSESPADLKLFGDQAFCSGINQMILHSYVHQPFDEKPGLTLGRHGSEFNRGNPWWQYANGWIKYQARIQSVLQKGKISGDVLYYLGDQFPQFSENKTISDLPAGYHAIACNYDILQRITIEQGKLKFSNNQKFQILVLPDQGVMEFPTLQKIEELVREGAVVYGPKPEKMLSLKGKREHEKDFRKLVDKIWNVQNKEGITKNSYGKGLVIWNEPISRVLSELKMPPVFTTNFPDSPDLMFIYKKTESQDIFFVVNQKDCSLNRECLFRVDGKVPEIWNPMTGEIRKPAVYSSENGQIRLPLTFRPKESLIFVFSKGYTEKFINKVFLGLKQIFPVQDLPDADISVPSATFRQNSLDFVAEKNGVYTFIFDNGSKHMFDLSAPEVYEIKAFTGKIEFFPAYKGSIAPIEISGLKSLTEYQDTQIKYFTGTAKYQIGFTLPPDYLATGDSVLLRFGDIGEVAEVRLNDQFLGNIWMSNTLIPINNLLKGVNHLEITVANTCRNRIIGDLTGYGKLQTIWTPAPVGKLLDKSYPLKPTGIIGPMQLVKYSVKTIN